MSDSPMGPDGGFFAAPPPPQQRVEQWPPQPASTGYGPPSPPSYQTDAESLPPLVVSAVTSLTIAGVAALWLGLTMLTFVSAFGGDDGGSGVQAKGAFLLVNGLVDLPLAYFLLRGFEHARWAVSAVCGWWVLYWLYQLTRAAKAFSEIGLAPAGFGIGRLTFLAALGLLILAGWAALTGVMLWLSGSNRHFTATG